MSGKILVVDDSITLVDIMKAALEEAHFDVITASDGEEALEKVYNERPDLVLLDVEMPKINGYKVCKILKKDPNTREIPVIMLTVKTGASDRKWGLGMGADEYLTKPFDIEDVIEIIKERLKHRKTEDRRPKTTDRT